MNTHDRFYVGQEVIEGDEAQLSLEMGVFAQVAARVAVLSAETLLDTENVPQGGQASFEVQLRALCQKRILPVIVQLEQRRSALDLSLHETRRSDFEQVMGHERFSEGGQESGTELEDSRRCLSSQDEVAEIGQNRRI